MNDDYIADTIKIYDSVAENYAKQTATHAPVKQRSKFVTLVKTGKILDAGCGPGRDTKYFSDLGFEVTGVDLSKELLKIAEKFVPRATFIQQDLRDLSFDIESFNGIWACASLLHLKRIEIPKVLSDFKKFLKPKGILYVHVKKGIGEIEKVEPSIPNAKRFFTLFTQSELEKYIRDAGFQILECFEYKELKTYQTGEQMTSLSCFAQKPL